LILQLLTTKRLLQGGDRHVRPTQIDYGGHSKDGKFRKNSLHRLELQKR
jgi:hypothetical protein